MDKVKAMFSEVKMEILKVELIYSFLDSLMLFFIIYFVISLFNIKFIYALAIPGAIATIYFVVSLSRRMKRSSLTDMENANPQLREILRTAHDNQKEDNIMVRAMFDDLKSKLRTASSGKMIDSKKITTRVISAIFIVFMIVLLSSITINLKKIDIPFDKLNFLSDNGKKHTEGNITDLVFNQTDVIYGDASIAKLGSEVVNIKVNPTMSDIDLSDVSDAEKRELRSGGVPQEIGVTADAYNNQKVLEEAEAAVNYSQRISGIK